MIACNCGRGESGDYLAIMGEFVMSIRYRVKLHSHALPARIIILIAFSQLRLHFSLPIVTAFVVSVIIDVIAIVDLGFRVE